MKSYVAKEETAENKWYVVDATDQPAGRLAVVCANLLRGKTKPTFTPHVAMGDFVVVINAAKVKLTGSKEQKKLYSSFSGYPGGLKQATAKAVRERNPTRIITHAVGGMLPDNKLSRRLMRRLKVYAGAEHPHACQNPETLAVDL